MSNWQPTLSLETPVVGRRAWVTDAVVTQGESLHEVAQVTVIHQVARGTSSASGWSLSSAGVLREGQPVALRYGTTDSSTRFYGYVTAVSVLGDEMPQTTIGHIQVPVVYTCIGPTYPMQSQVNRIWPSTTASAVARKLARGAGLRPQAQRSARLFDAIPQQAQSDFAFLRDLADEVGYRLAASGTTLALTHPLVSLRERGEGVPSFTFDKGSTDTVKSWESTSGQLDPLGGLRARREGYAFNRTTGALIRTVAAGTQDAPVTQYSSRPFASQAEAAQVLGAEAQRECLWVHAKATVVGDCRVRTGTELEMTGGALGPDDPGLWMVRSATHRISVEPYQPLAGQYWTDVTLGRNRIGGLEVVPKDQVVDAIPGGTALIDGRWRAQYVGRA